MQLSPAAFRWGGRPGGEGWTAGDQESHCRNPWESRPRRVNSFFSLLFLDIRLRLSGWKEALQIVQFLWAQLVGGGGCAILMNKRFSDSPQHGEHLESSIAPPPPAPVVQFIMLLALPSANNKQQVHSHALTTPPPLPSTLLCPLDVVVFPCCCCDFSPRPHNCRGGGWRGTKGGLEN